MRRSLLLLLFGLLPGCILAIGVDEDDWDGDHSSLRLATWSSHSREASAGVLSGRVLDQNGAPVEALVTAVFPNASYRQECDEDGNFSLGPVREGAFNLKAASADGAVAVMRGLSLTKGEGLANLELRLEPGATLLLSYQGEADSYRCALFHKGNRVDDFTLEKGVQEKVIVPAGRIPMQLYEGLRVFAANEADVAPGSTTTVVFQVD
jgi:hypothetical protein